MFDTTVDEMIGTAAAREANTVLRELAEMQPGPFMAIALSGINLNDLTGDDRVTVAQARQRMASHYTAETYEAMASVVDAYQDEFDNERDHAAEAAAYELRAALCLTRRAADVELSLALDLCDRLPRVFDALSAGLIDRRRAGTIVWQTTHLTDDEARLVVDRIIDQAPNLTTGQLMARIRKLCAEVDPGEAQQRYEQAVSDRRVVMDPTDVGTANISARDLPPDKAAAAAQRVNQIARSLRRDGETRTMDQLRADVFLDLLCGEHAKGKGGTVDIHVDLSMLAELNDRAGEFAGYGPVISDIARKVTAEQTDAEWRYTVTHNGQPIAIGTTHRRPNAAQRRLVEATNATCIFPGCRMPATQCDIDHRIEWSRSGQTNTKDLAPLCEHDHTGKHRHGWTYRILENGEIEWTSPLGKTYVNRGRSP